MWPQVYCAAKAGLAQFVRAAAEPLHQKNIRLVGLCPGLVSTTLVSLLACMLVSRRHIRMPLVAPKCGEPQHMRRHPRLSL